ncbi:MAG: hypothetical protein QME96_06595 [Myxococcota bacterium]|nr:hypothetical protein [Myxococcota bacterium]
MSAVARYAGWQHFAAATPTRPTAATWGDGAAAEAIDAGLAPEDLVPIDVPSHCNVESVEVHLNTIAGGPTTITVGIWRDAAGDVVFVSDRPTAATQDIRLGLTTAAQGGAVWKIDKDHHPTANSVNDDNDEMPGNQTTRLFVGFYLNVGTANVDRIVVNWRC